MLFNEKKFRELLPPEMLAEPRFVRYFLKAKPEGGTAKIPLGNHSDPNTWGKFDDVVKQLENESQGIGYCFLGGDVHGLDIDHCRNPKSGQICNEAMLLLSRMGAWAEYSVSGCGLHVFFKGQVRGKQLTETCLQYWNPKNAPRFFALTCDMVGEAFTKLKDIGDDFNYIFATAAHISAKIREELKEVDYEQWVKLPEERAQVQVPVPALSKPKTKSRKVCKDFDLKDFLNFYNIPIDNECDNEIGHCIRVRTCPIKGEPHVGQNGTTTNFIYPTKDGGIAFHCQSTGCVEYGIAEAIKQLAERSGPYGTDIYQVEQPTERKWEYNVTFEDVSEEEIEEMKWLWPDYLPQNQLVHSAGASSQGKSPAWRDIIARIASGHTWPNGKANEGGPRTVIVMANEDDWPTVVIPHLKSAGANFNFIKRVKATLKKGDKSADIVAALDRDIEQLDKAIREYGDVAALLIDPITNYLGRAKMNREDEMRSVLMPMAQLAQSNNVSVNTIGHFNKSKDVQMLDKVMGARAFVGVARQALFFTNDEDEENEFSHVMGFGRKTTVPGLKYRTVERDLHHKNITYKVIAVDWYGASKQDMEQAVTTPQKQSDKAGNKQIKVLLKTLLRDGAKPSSVVKQAIEDAGLSVNNLSRAARGIALCNQAGGKSEWYLPLPEQAEFDR